MNEKEYTQILEFEDSFLKTEFEPLLDEAVLSLDISQADQTNLQQQCRNTLSEILYQRENRRRTLAGFDILIETLDRMGGDKHCQKELQNAGELLFAKLDSVEKVQKSVQEVRNLKNDQSMDVDHTQAEITQALSTLRPFMYDLGISDSSFKVMYEAGVWLFSHGQYDKAASLFQFLTFLNALCFEPWYSMGLCYHKLNQWPQAISSYSVATIIDSTDPTAYIGLIACYKMIGDNENAHYSAQCARYVVTHSHIADKEQKALLQQIQDIEERK